VPVCSDRGELHGLITDRDLVIRGFGQKSAELSAGDIMSTQLVTVGPEASTHEAALLMAKHRVRRLPVVKDNILTGILSLGDIARKRAFVDEAGDALSAISHRH